MRLRRRRLGRAERWIIIFVHIKVNSDVNDDEDVVDNCEMAHKYHT